MTVRTATRRRTVPADASIAIVFASAIVPLLVIAALSVAALAA